MTNVSWDSERRRLRPQFIRRAAAYMDGTKIWEKSGFARDEISLRTLVRVADESVDLEEVLHFVRAKIGQAEPGRKWRYRDFGESLIRELTDGLAPVRKELEERLGRSAGDGEIAVHVSRWFVAAALEHYRYRREVEREKAEKGAAREAGKVRGGEKGKERGGARDAKKRVFGDETAVRRREEEEGEEKKNATTEAQRKGDLREKRAGEKKEEAGVGAEAELTAVAVAEAGAGAGAAASENEQPATGAE